MLAFSCNYRDRSLIFAAARRTTPGFYTIGSEFVGEVIETGARVEHLSVGDRVIADNAYVGMVNHQVSGPQGLLTNHASSEYQSIHARRLTRIPDSMSIDQGAAFGIAAQTVYSMIRKADPRIGQTVLLTAGRSNTSLLALSALRKHGVRTCVLTSGTDSISDFKRLGADAVHCASPLAGPLESDASWRQIMQEFGGFDVVLDPFHDAFIDKVIPCMKPEGRYVTCGQWRQMEVGATDTKPVEVMDRSGLLTFALLNNLTLIGNCLGNSADLRQALSDFDRGLVSVPIDSVFRGQDCGPFLNRSFEDPHRFGKVVFDYTM